MDDFSIAGPPCPICGAHAFSWDLPQPDDVLFHDDAPMQYHPRECAECGNVQLLLTRGAESMACEIA